MKKLILSKEISFVHKSLLFVSVSFLATLSGVKIPWAGIIIEFYFSYLNKVIDPLSFRSVNPRREASETVASKK